jgi:hypothetical protein
MEIFKYNEVTRKPNPLKNFYALDKKKDTIRPLSANIEKLQNARTYKKVKKLMEDKGIKYDAKLLPKSDMIALGEFEKEGAGISEMVQRQLDTVHCGNIIHPDTYKEALSQSLYAVKKSNGCFQLIDGQHTVTDIATLVKDGLMEFEGTWQELKHPTLYIETDDLSFALKAFALINGKGKKKISRYKELENAVQVVRVCDNTDDEDDVLVEKKVSIAQNNNCFAVEQNSNLSTKAGTFTHISKFLSLKEDVIEKATKWHDTYFHYNPVNGALWFLFADLTSGWKMAKLKLTDEFLEEIAGMSQNLFSDYEEYHSEIQTAWRKFTKTKYGTEYNWNDDAIAVGLVQLYKKFGGTADVPGYMLDEFNEYTAGSSLIDFLPDYITEQFDD